MKPADALGVPTNTTAVGAIDKKKLQARVSPQAPRSIFGDSSSLSLFSLRRTLSFLSITLQFPSQNDDRR
jgi:hypothetical protein